MQLRKLIEDKIGILESSIKTFKIMCGGTIMVGIITVMVSLNLIHILPASVDKSGNIELLKFGFSAITMFSPIVFMTFIFAKKNELTNLAFARDNIDAFETLKDHEKEILKKIIENVIDNKGKLI